MNGVTSHSVPGALSPDARWYQAVGKGVSQAMLSSLTHPPKFVEELTKREELEKCFAKDGKFLDQGSVIARKVRLDSVTNRDTAAAFRRVTRNGRQQCFDVDHPPSPSAGPVRRWISFWNPRIRIALSAPIVAC